MPPSLAASNVGSSAPETPSDTITLAADSRQEPTLQGIYAQFAEISGAMLEAARRGDWDTVTARERSCSQLIELLRSHAALHPVDENERQACMRLVRQVLADDAAIRDLAEPWLRELGEILSPAGQRMRINAFR